ncbi:hypothetical protein QBC34DRAFT_383577 [Podospora aff. communis PSN243]|uniref:Uncharacterized protein n=1 Tax=Podospora aff. communis PSN243 TaxID=3040156 RepID=A0AAV9GCF8_9PEZI|nr:hypothetical protein QBC34DRAFT_383577 [Podospora aff. communis PSN243]
MHLPTLAAVALGAITASASHLTLITRLDPGIFSSFDRQGIWHTNTGALHQVSIEGGCRTNIGVPGVRELCMDFDKMRGHWWTTGNGKRCFRHSRGRMVGSCMKGTCWIDRWVEVNCNW